MIRSALIIYCDKSKHGDLPGAAVDARNWEQYLKSNTGGAWHDSEITTLQSPELPTLERRLRAMKDADIAVVAFSGHGFHKRGSDIDESFVCINDSDDVSVQSLNAGADRTLIVADSCRGIVMIEAAQKSAMHALALERALPARIRKAYEDAFRLAERGAIYMYSCDINEAAGESGTRGGDFSSSLITAGVDWAEDSRSHSILDTKDAFDKAFTLVKQRSPQQAPQYNAGRRLNHFPFAVT